MAGFNDFVQVELPLRPSVASDGPAGHVPVRSTNALAVRELVWKDPNRFIADSLATAATYGYNASGNINLITETLAGGTQTTVITYNLDETVNSVAVTFNGSTRTDTYSYDGDGNILSYASVVT
jgi:hypothetical protein